MSLAIVGDLHLTRQSPSNVVADFTALLDDQQQIIVAGDLFDLSTDAPKEDRVDAINAIVGSHPPLSRAVGELLARGGELTLIGGNHDAHVGHDAETLRDSFGLEGAERERLTTSPWFVRRDGLHIEHGHLYDPDNAPAHPLINGEPSLGVHFSAEFMHPTGAYRYLSNNDSTPLTLFLSSFRWYGPRAPYVIYRYFHAAFTALARSGPWYRAHGELGRGEEQHARFAEDAGVPTGLIDEIMRGRAPSTLESWSRTFARLYLDRVAATLLTGAGIAAFSGGKPVAGVALGGLGGMLMASSWLAGHDRYGGSVVNHLDAAAARIASHTDAEYVVFGHTHREALDALYANTGSFAFPRDAPGRPYLRATRDGRWRIERAYV
jgi:predicted phosphodiesterase